jgi:flagellar motor switch protein FliN/FliY
MERKQIGVEKARQLANALGSAVELMAGESAKATIAEAAAPAWKDAGAALALKCTFGFTEAPLWIVAAEEAWSEIANAAVTGAGIEDADADLRKQTWRELISQAANPLIADRTQDSAVKLTLEEMESAPADEPGEVFAVELTFGSKTFSRFYLFFTPALVSAFGGNAETAPREMETRVPPTLERLLDVELPLSVSFGRTTVPVHDILKLSSGSIIELNCPANDLVEIIVNNCMIARGEVVVIEGNYGVRVREIISRSERMALQNVKGHGAGPMKLSA